MHYIPKKAERSIEERLNAEGRLWKVEERVNTITQAELKRPGFLKAFKSSTTLSINDLWGFAASLEEVSAMIDRLLLTNGLLPDGQPAHRAQVIQALPTDALGGYPLRRFVRFLKDITEGDLLEVTFNAEVVVFRAGATAEVIGDDGDGTLQINDGSEGAWWLNSSWVQDI